MRRITIALAGEVVSLPFNDTPMIERERRYAHFRRYQSIASAAYAHAQTLRPGSDARALWFVLGSMAIHVSVNESPE